MKLMLDKTTHKILNCGQLPWANQDTLTNYEIIDIPNNTACPLDILRYFYINSQFVLDTTPTEAEQLRDAIKVIAQSAVGVKLADLTATQIKSLMACLLYQAGGVDLKTMAVKPLADWVR